MVNRYFIIFIFLLIVPIPSSSDRVEPTSSKQWYPKFPYFHRTGFYNNSFFGVPRYIEGSNISDNSTLNDNLKLNFEKNIYENFIVEVLDEGNIKYHFFENVHKIMAFDIFDYKAYIVIMITLDNFQLIIVDLSTDDIIFNSQLEFRYIDIEVNQGLLIMRYDGGVMHFYNRTSIEKIQEITFYEENDFEDTVQKTVSSFAITENNEFWTYNVGVNTRGSYGKSDYRDDALIYADNNGNMVSYIRIEIEIPKESDEICIVDDSTIAYSRGDSSVLLYYVGSATYTDGFEYLGNYNIYSFLSFIPIIYVFKSKK
ncbi:MAG: hypothetical protein INQ03_08845 [Candidatus Heimdallarchaeota archaeon]|nr:hypothetical protein [Candidatus Heimdallarchaeota archaeon]